MADAGQFQTGGDAYNDEMDVTEDVIAAIDAQGGITGGGLVYGDTSAALEFVTEEYYRSVWSRWNTPEQLDSMVHFKDRNEEGLLADRVQLYGMEQFPLDHLTVLEGDLSKLSEPGGRYVAAVYSDDDYGRPELGSHWARLGDTVTIRYVEEYEYYNPDTGEVYGPWENVPEGANWVDRAVKYRDVEYEVAALVTVLLSCRKPGKMAARVSPIEAVRYTEGGNLKRKAKRRAKGVSLFSMAWANLGRSRGKTAVTVTSLSLAVVLLTVTVNFANGFDMDKYVSNFTASDFIVADAGQFQTGGEIFNTDMGIPQSVIDDIDAQGGITGGGLVYGETSAVQEFVTEDYYRSVWSRWNDPETLDLMVASKDRNEDGLLSLSLIHI